MNISHEIIRIRKNNGLTQEAFGERIGVSRQSVTKWENGESTPEIEKLVIISNQFQVTLDSLIKGTPSCSLQKTEDKYETRKIIEFLCLAKKSTYAAKSAEIESSRLNSHDLAFEMDNFIYLDSYFGGERFTGEEIVWVSKKTTWGMNYMGRVLSDSFSGDFLKKCLLKVSVDLPYRGPGLYRSGDYTYHCKIDGTFDWFKGEEEIFHKMDKVYECLFHGGSIK